MTRKPSPVKSNYRPQSPLGRAFPTQVSHSMGLHGKHALDAYSMVPITGTSPISSRLSGVSAPFTNTGKRWEVCAFQHLLHAQTLMGL